MISVVLNTNIFWKPYPKGKNFKKFAHCDVLGSTVLITDTNGGIVERNKFDPFGLIEKQKTSTDNDKLFTGKEVDIETGLQYFGARYYDGFVGRWIGRDKFAGISTVPQSENRYLYTMNNPINAIDPDGNLTFFLHGRLTKSDRWNKKFVKDVQAIFNDNTKPVLLNWHNKSRKWAAEKMQKIIAGHKFAEGETLNFYSASAGGNAVKILTHLKLKSADGKDIVPKFIVNVVTPQREKWTFDMKNLNPNNVINMFNPKDSIQRALSDNKAQKDNQAFNIPVVTDKKGKAAHMDTPQSSSTLFKLDEHINPTKSSTKTKKSE